MRKHIFLLILISCLFLAPQHSHAQLGEYGWRVGGGVGNMYYYGDLSAKFEAKKALTNYFKYDKGRDLSYSVFLERKLTPGIGLMFTGTRGYITFNDRIDNADTPEFARALNFRTKIDEIDAAFVFKPDNDRILGYRFFLAPYIFAGGGVTSFSISGNLKDADGNFYDYANNPVQDDSFETDLTNIGSESNENYANKLVPHASFGLGLRFRFLRYFSLHLQSDLRYAFTDYLDDVGSPTFRTEYDNPTQQFAGKPNLAYSGNRGKDDKLNDIYANTTVSLRVSFGRRKDTFIPPVFFAPENAATTTESIKLIPNEVNIGGSTVVIYDTVRVIQQGYNTTLDSTMMGKAQAMIDSLEKVKASNRQVEQQLAQSQTEYKALLTELQNSRSTNVAEREQTQKRLDELVLSVNKLSIAAANNIDSTTAKGSATAQVDSAKITELAKLRNELERLQKTQNVDAQNRAQIGSDIGKAPQVGNSVITDANGRQVVLSSESDMTKANLIAETYYKRFQGDIDSINAQIAALSTIMVQREKMAAGAPHAPTAPTMPPAYIMPYPYMMPPSYPVPPSDAPTGMNSTDNQAVLNAIQSLNTQLNSINSRLSTLENAPRIATTAPTTPTTPVIINTPTPAPSNNDANSQAMMQTMQDMRRQLDALNGKISGMENRPAPVPQQPTGVTVEKPVIVEKPVVGKPVVVERPVVNTVTYEREAERLNNISIYFDNNSVVIKPSELDKLAKMAAVLNRYPQATLHINGYADNTGNDEYNHKLSEKRANAVKDRLAQAYRVNPAQLSVHFYGKSAASAAANPYDRRVDLQWVK